MTTATIIKILTSKYTYIATTILFFILTIVLTVKLIQAKVSFEKQKEFEQRIENLEIEKITLSKNLEQEKQKQKLEFVFTNSFEAVKNISNKELSDDEKNALDSVSNDFYSFMRGN